MSEGYLTAEARARAEIDRQLVACGWAVQDHKDMNLYARQGVAVREFIMAPGHGRANYPLFVDGKAVGAVEAKPSGRPLAGVESRSAKYAAGLPKDLELSMGSPRCSAFVRSQAKGLAGSCRRTRRMSLRRCCWTGSGWSVRLSRSPSGARGKRHESWSHPRCTVDRGRWRVGSGR